MHIIGGEFRRRTLITPKGELTRPTSSRLREAVFNICQHSILDASFLDICAGSGAMGLEAISRGAKYATLIEENKLAQNAIIANIKALKVEEKVRLFSKDALTTLKALVKAEKKFNLCYVDPPYHSKELIEAILHFLNTEPLLEVGATLFVEDAHNTSHEELKLSTLQCESKRKYGDACLYTFEKIG